MKRSILYCLATSLLFTVNSIAQDNTVERLSKELEGLEYKLDALNARLPFREMAIMTLVASDQPNTTVVIATEDYGFRHKGEIYFLNTERFHSTNFPASDGVAYFGPKPVYEDEKYSVIIFKELPTAMKDRHF